MPENIELQKFLGGGTKTGYPSVDKPWLKYYEGVGISSTETECSLYEYVYKNNKDHLQDIALIYFGRKITYGQFFDEIDALAECFEAEGVREGEIVTVALPSIPEALYIVYALNKIGAVANMIHPLAGRKEIIHYLNEVESRVAFFFEKNMEILGDGIRETSVEKAVVVSPRVSLPTWMKAIYRIKVHGKVRNGYEKYERFRKNRKSCDPVHKKNPHTTAIISHTGGTTGEPKGVMCSDAGLNSLMWQLLCRFEYERQEISLSVLPPFVNYSLVESMMAMLAVGFQVVLVPEYKPEKFAQYIRRYHPNEILSIPAYWEAILRIPGIEKEDFSCLKHIYYGGEAMNAQTQTKINEILADGGSQTELCTGLGATEMGAGATLTYEECNPLNSVGIPMVFVNCKIVHPETMEEVSYNTEGEICFSGPTMMLGYYKKEEATAEVIKEHQDGIKWLHTGDIGYITEDGIIYVTGRIKRIIMTKGEDGQVTKMFPDRIEKALYACPEVELCCAIGVPDEKRINVPIAFVVLKKGMKKTADTTESLLNMSRKELPEYMVPAKIEYRIELPHTDRGKIDYRELERKYREESS